MNRTLAVLALATVFSFATIACKQEAATTDPAKEQAAKAEEAKKAADEAAKKKDEEAAKKLAEAQAEAEKARAEAEKAAQAQAAAEEEKARAEEKALRETLTKDLAALTGDLVKVKAALNDAKEAWKEEATRAAALGEALREAEQLDAERGAVEALMVQAKLAEAQTKMEVLKAKFQPFKEKGTALAEPRPVDPKKWETMLTLLAGETCLLRRNLPAQDFLKEREVLFSTLGMDRVEYEQLRAAYNQAPKPEDQARLGRFVSEKCPETLTAPEPKPEEKPEGAPAETGEPKEEGKGPDKEPVESPKAEPVKLSGTFSGTLFGAGKKGSIQFVVAGGALKSASATIGTVSIPLAGSFGDAVMVTGKTGIDHVRCKGSVTTTKIEGTCDGTFEKKRFQDAKFTALKKK